MRHFRNCYLRGLSLNPCIANLFLHTHYANEGKYLIPPGLSRVQEHLRTNFQRLGYTHVFEVQLFNSVVDDDTGSRVIPEIDMAAAQNRK